MSVERMVVREGDGVYLETENDGWTFMKHGPETTRTQILSVDDKGLHLCGGAIVSSSNGRLEQDAMDCFAAIAKECQTREGQN